MPKTRLPTALTNRFKKLDTATQKPDVTDEVISFYCVLDKPTMYVRLSKPCKCICLCGQPHNSIAEAKAHIVGKGCQYLFHWVGSELQLNVTTIGAAHPKPPLQQVEENRSRAWFQTTKQDLSLAGGEVAKCITELVCESIDEPFPKEYWTDQPILTEEHTYQHALYIHGKRAKRMQKQQQQQLRVRAKLKRKPSESQICTASNQEGDMPQCVHHGTEQSSDIQTRQMPQSEPPCGQVLGINLGITWLQC